MTKMGRPTDNPKNYQVKIRLTEDEVYRLKYCAYELGLTQTDIINEGIQGIYDSIIKSKRERANMLKLNDEKTVEAIAKEYGMSDREIELQRKENGLWVMMVDEFMEEVKNFVKRNDFTDEDVEDYLETYGAESWNDLVKILNTGSGCFATGLHKLEYKGVRLVLVAPV